jgi:hypothetical protein
MERSAIGLTSFARADLHLPIRHTGLVQIGAGIGKSSTVLLLAGSIGMTRSISVIDGVDSGEWKLAADLIEAWRDRTKPTRSRSGSERAGWSSSVFISHADADHLSVGQFLRTLEMFKRWRTLKIDYGGATVGPPAALESPLDLLAVPHHARTDFRQDLSRTTISQIWNDAFSAVALAAPDGSADDVLELLSQTIVALTYSALSRATRIDGWAGSEHPPCRLDEAQDRIVVTGSSPPRGDAGPAYRWPDLDRAQPQYGGFQYDHELQRRADRAAIPHRRSPPNPRRSGGKGGRAIRLVRCSCEPHGYRRPQRYAVPQVGRRRQ